MTDDRTLERAARSWLEEGPTRAPDRTVEAALSRIQTTSQERALWVPWRLPTMKPIARAAMLAGAAIVAAVAIYLLRPGTPSVGTPTAAATPSPIALIRPGTYLGPELRVADIVASMDADPDLTAADRTQLIDVLFAIKDKSTWRASLVLQAGQWVQRQTVDGTLAVGSVARYSFPDDHTVVLVETINGADVTSRYEVTVSGDSFTLRRLDPPTSPVDTFVIRTLYEAGPFTLVP